MSRAAEVPAPPALVHGMDHGLAVPDWPELTLQEVGALGRSFPNLRGKAQILWRSPRPFASAARIAVEGRQFFVKRHARRVRDVHHLREEHGFVEHLRGHGLPVPALMYSESGETALAAGEWTYEVHALAAGRDLYRDRPSWTLFRSPRHAWNAGRALARLHGAARSYGAPARQERPLLAGWELAGADDYAAALRSWIDRRAAVRGFLEQGGGLAAAMDIILDAVMPWREPVGTVLAGLERQWIHYDLHASNLFWTGEDEDADVAGIIDFGLSNRATAILDLATAVERNAVRWLDQDAADPAAQPLGDEDLAVALVRGYCAQRPLSADEVAALLPLLVTGHVEYALAEVDYFNGVVNNPANARLAYPDFLLGHVRWFAGGPGRRFLDAVARAAAG